MSPRTRPHLEPVLTGSFPEREVTWMPLARIDLAAGAGEQLVGAVSRELAVRGEARDVVVDGAADLVRMALLDELCDEVDHLRDVVARVRVIGRRPDVDAR